MAQERASPCHFWFSNPEGVEVTISSESVCKDRRQATSYDGTAAWIPITAKRRIPSTALQRAGSDDDAREGSPTGFQWRPRHGGPWLARQCQGHVLSAHHTCTGSLSFSWSFFLPPVCLSRDRAGCHHEVFSGRQLSHPPTVDPCRHCLPSLFLGRPAWALFHRKLMNSARAGGLLPPGLGNVGEVASLGAFCACSERRQLFQPRCLSL